MIQYILTALLFSPDGTYTTTHVGEPESYQECLDDQIEAATAEYADSVLECTPIEVKDEPKDAAEAGEAHGG